MKPHRLLAFCAALLVQLLSFLDAQDKVTYYANDVQLVGTLGDGLKIEMLLERSGTEPFWKVSGTECIDVTGSYFYRSQVRPISLKGRMCLGNHTLELFHLEPGSTEWTERFSGLWDGASGTYAGKWLLKKTNKMELFSLKAIEPEVKDEDKQAFFGFLNEKLRTGPEAEWFENQYRIEGFEWGSGMGKAVNTERVTVSHFSPLRLDCDHNWSNAGTSDDRNETFQLLPTDWGPFVLYINRSDWSSPTGEETEEEGLIFEYDCGTTVELWKWEKESWIDVTVQYLPTDVLNLLKGNAAKPICGAEVLHDAIRIGDAKLYWVDGKFEGK
jgi:hypothetical protein